MDIKAAAANISASRNKFNNVRMNGFTATPISSKEKNRGIRGRFYLSSPPFVVKKKNKSADSGSSNASNVTLCKLSVVMPSSYLGLTMFKDVTVTEDGSLSFEPQGSDKIKTDNMEVVQMYKAYNDPILLKPYQMFEVSVFAYSTDLEKIDALVPGPIILSFWGVKSIYEDVLSVSFNGNIKTIEQEIQFAPWSNYKFLSVLAEQPVNKPIRQIGHEECQEAADKKFFSCDKTQTYVINKTQKFIEMEENEIIAYLIDKPVGFITVENAMLVTDENESLVKTFNSNKYLDLRMSLFLSSLQSSGGFMGVDSTIQLWASELCSKVDFNCMFHNGNTNVSVSDKMLSIFEAFLLGQFRYIDWVLICQDSAKDANRIVKTDLVDDSVSKTGAEFSTAFERPILYLNFPSFVINTGLKINKAVADNLITLNSSKKAQYIVVYQPSADEIPKIEYAAAGNINAPIVNYSYMTPDLRKRYIEANPSASFFMLSFNNAVCQQFKKFWEECEHKDIEKFMSYYIANWSLRDFDEKDTQVFIYCVDESRIEKDVAMTTKFIDYFCPSRQTGSKRKESNDDTASSSKEQKIDDEYDDVDYE